jgi:hypothetical protein
MDMTLLKFGKPTLSLKVAGSPMGTPRRPGEGLGAPAVIHADYPK